MYNRYDNDVHPRETLVDSLSSIIDHNDSLRDHIKLLNKVNRITTFSYTKYSFFTPLLLVVVRCLVNCMCGLAS